MGWGSAAFSSAVNFAGAIPAYGSVISAGSAAYEGTSAIMSAVDGDYEGAQDHGTAAVLSGLSMIPAYGTGIGLAAGSFDAGAAAARADGATDNQAPTSSELLSDFIFDGLLGIQSGEAPLQ